MECRERMEGYLRENGVPFELLEHDRAYTMQEAAAALHLPGKQVAKVVIVKAGDAICMVIIPAPYRLNLTAVSTALGKKASLAKEAEFAGLFPDCAPGAMPPFGNLYDIPVYVDSALADESDIVFRVGTHRHVIRIAYTDFVRLSHPVVGEFGYLV
ncbi:MAG: YbaK/EbsC family protein [Anaerolineae bacterium]|nr:YbaK/EbsC family protein [Anaerolineae bacterium]